MTGQRQNSNPNQRNTPVDGIYDDETLRRRNDAIQRVNQIFRCSNMDCARRDLSSSPPPSPTLRRQNACIRSEIHGFICIACGRFEEVRIFF